MALGVVLGVVVMYHLGLYFYVDHKIDRVSALAGRQEWARRRIADAGAVVLRGPDRRVLALAAIDQQRSWTEIQLAGVVPAEQGRGRYGHLLAAVEDVCSTRRLVVSTQAHQTGIQRIWSRYGFEPVHNLLTVHLVAATQEWGRGLRTAEPKEGTPE